MNKLPSINLGKIHSSKQPKQNQQKECLKEDCCFQGKTTLKGQISQDQVSFSGPLTGSR